MRINQAIYFTRLIYHTFYPHYHLSINYESHFNVPLPREPQVQDYRKR